METVYVHIAGEDGVMAEMDELPKTTDQYIRLMNPRKRDGKDLHYLMEGVSIMMVPWWRITFIEIMPSQDADDVFTFIRD